MASFPDKGILVALRLPFDESGKLKRRSLEAHLGWLKSMGIHGILVLGSTGYFPMLSVSERKEAMETVAELACGLPVVANISDMHPDNVAEMGRFAGSLGLAGVAVMPPIFYPTKDADQLAFFEYAAASAGLPVMLYNFPELNCNRIGLETIREFAARAPMVAIKQSGGEFAYHEDLINLGRECGFAVFSGSDTRLPEVFRMGAAGCIGGLVNFVPDLMVEQFNVFAEGREGSLEPTAGRMRKIGEIIDRETFPSNVSAGMLARGLDPGVNLHILSESTRQGLRAITEELHKCFTDWNLSMQGKADS